MAGNLAPDGGFQTVSRRRLLAQEYGNMTSSYTTTGMNFTSEVSTPKQGGTASATTLAIIITLVLVTAFLVIIVCYLKRGGKLGIRKRRSSTSSSRGALEEHEVADNLEPQKRGETEDMFAIDYEANAEVQESREEYFYDEVFGQSHFEDEATNNAMRQLYSAPQTLPEEEMLDFDFETLGINIEDYDTNIKSSKKNHQ